MPNKMLIDASHPEETRVVVLHGNRIEEFDFESQDKKQLKGNIYLARVTRVEPSLQAAFVEYGGNRHGFLAFSEIHPDYYQIPVADRQALLRADAEAADAEEDEESGGDNRNRRRRRGGKNRERNGEESRRGSEVAARSGEPSDGESVPVGEAVVTEAFLTDEPAVEGAIAGTAAGESVLVPDEDFQGLPGSTAEVLELSSEDASPFSDESEPAEEADFASALGANADIAAPGFEDAGLPEGEEDPSTSQPEAPEPSEDDEDTGAASDEETSDKPSMAAAIEGDVISEEAPTRSEPVETDRGGSIQEVASGVDENEVVSVGAEDAMEEVQRSRRNVRRSYKIQEVIKRRQILLVQVVKEERGNKGAALTTYLSLAGRYSVLMPNTARGGGISRKITNIQDRKRLKEVVADLEVPQGMGVILRTAGESRTKAEIKRDYEYLMRMWETVRNLTLASTAPALVYEEGSLIKRSVRDLYNKDIDEIMVAGEDGYREAKDFMRMLMPSHAKVVQPYRDTTPLFARNGIDAQLDRMLQPQVTLKSGGYIIINQTEALVSIDVNSGRSTREHSIEDTALQTNLEASEEVARQLRLRDLAGLIVIDYIDMEENRNNRAVEKRLKDCLKNDRARIQVGRISHFGLMEMSRQRIRASVLESTMKPCPQCGGTGHIRSDSSIALFVVRGIEEFLLKDSRSHITVRTPVATALYVLNHKRSNIVEIETRFGVKVTLEADETVGAQHFAIFRGALAEKPLVADAPALPVYLEPEPEDEDEMILDEGTESTEVRETREGSGDEAGQRDRKRRRRKRKRGGREGAMTNGDENTTDVSIEALQPSVEDGEEAEPDSADLFEDGESPVAEAEGERKKRRRGRRGGKRSRPDEASPELTADAEFPSMDQATDMPRSADSDGPGAIETGSFAPLDVEPQGVETPAVEPEGESPAPVKKPRRSRAKKPAEVSAEPEIVATGPSDAVATEAASAEPEASNTVGGPAEEPRPRSTRRTPVISGARSDAPVVSSVVAEETPASEEKPKRAGWWQRRSFF